MCLKERMKCIRFRFPYHLHWLSMKEFGCFIFNLFWCRFISGLSMLQHKTIIDILQSEIFYSSWIFFFSTAVEIPPVLKIVFIYNNKKSCPPTLNVFYREGGKKRNGRNSFFSIDYVCFCQPP